MFARENTPETTNLQPVLGRWGRCVRGPRKERRFGHRDRALTRGRTDGARPEEEDGSQESALSVRECVSVSM